jgi:hypothetical protein
MLVECNMGLLGDFTELWDVATGQRRGRFEHPNVEGRGSSTFHLVALTADSKRVAIDLHRWIEIRDVATMKHVANVDSHGLHIDSLSFNPDGSALAGLQRGAIGTHGARETHSFGAGTHSPGRRLCRSRPIPMCSWR